MFTHDRGFTFDNLPTVIDPACASLEVEVVAFGDAAGARPRWVVFHRVSVPDGALPLARVFRNANIYADREEYAQATILLGYDPAGVLTVLFTRSGGEWRPELVPEEMTGAHTQYPSLRFVFESGDAMRETLVAVMRLRRAESAGAAYREMERDAGVVVSNLMRCPEGPRVVEVAAPTGSGPVDVSRGQDA